MRRRLTKASLFCTALCVLANLHAAIADESPNTLALVSSNTQSRILSLNSPTHSNRLDSLTELALEHMLSGDWSSATQLAQELIDAFPDYALGHFILAETHTVSALSEPLLSSLPNYSTTLINLLLEARARAQHLDLLAKNVITSVNQLPSELVQIGKHTDHVVLVDLNASHLYLFDTTTTVPQFVKKHYISSGTGGFGKLLEGDLKTPLGIYRIRGFRSDDSLPALYGSGALMLNYPNTLDKSLGRTGSGIWLHGNPPSNRSRSPRSSEGCVTMANDHLLDLYQQIDLARTNVVLTNAVRWQDMGSVVIQRDRFQELFNQYRRAWLNNDIVDLMSIYTPDSLPSVIDYTGGASARKVASGNAENLQLLSPIGIELEELENMQVSDITIMLNPTSNRKSEKSHLMMEFELGDSSTTRVTLFWEQSTAGFWQIKREEIDSAGGV